MYIIGLNWFLDFTKDEVEFCEEEREIVFRGLVRNGIEGGRIDCVE